jgi:hypothetical protein
LPSLIYSAGWPVSGLKALPWRAKWSRNSNGLIVGGVDTVEAARWGELARVACWCLRTIVRLGFGQRLRCLVDLVLLA